MSGLLPSLPRLLLGDPEIIGRPECPLIERWTLVKLGKRGPKLLLHHFPANVDDRDVHDHPRGFVTLILQGGYDDIVRCPNCGGLGQISPMRGNVLLTVIAPCGECVGSGLVVGDVMRPGMIRRRPAWHTHRTRAHADGCWSLVLMGRMRREWGFWRPDTGWWPWRRYDQVYGGVMRCEPGEDA